MGAFLFAAMTLVAITMLLLLRPWQHRNVEHDASAREINAGIYCSVAFCLELKRLFARMTFCKMSRALLVQMNGLGLVLW